MPDAEFSDPRLVQVYDADKGWARDDDFFLSSVSRHGPVRMLDLGCGTGRPTLDDGEFVVLAR